MVLEPITSTIGERLESAFINSSRTPIRALKKAIASAPISGLNTPFRYPWLISPPVAVGCGTSATQGVASSPYLPVPWAYCMFWTTVQRCFFAPHSAPFQQSEGAWVFEAGKLPIRLLNGLASGIVNSGIRKSITN